MTKSEAGDGGPVFVTIGRHAINLREVVYVSAGHDPELKQDFVSISFTGTNDPLRLIADDAILFGKILDLYTKRPETGSADVLPQFLRKRTAQNGQQAPIGRW